MPLSIQANPTMTFITDSDKSFRTPSINKIQNKCELSESVSQTKFDP